MAGNGGRYGGDIVDGRVNAAAVMILAKHCLVSWRSNAAPFVVTSFAARALVARFLLIKPCDDPFTVSLFFELLTVSLD
jgi:hypothetical protein